jgi:ABC-type oligopeptide transport system substrate-binding subunit
MTFASLVLSACQEETAEPTPITIVITGESGEEVIVTRVVRQTVQVVTTPVIEEVSIPVELDLPMIGSIGLLDPHATDDDNAFELLENLLVGLTRFDHANAAVEPELAFEWEVSDNGLVWTFRLRDDIYWVEHVSSGPGVFALRDDAYQPVRPVDAYDVQYSIQRACDPRTIAPDVFVLFSIDGCEELFMKSDITDADLELVSVRAIDNFTVEFKLTEPSSHFLTLTTTPIMRPVPVDRIEEMGDEWRLMDNFLTSGPFLVSRESVSDVLTVLERNPYWPIPFSGNVDQVNIIHFDDETSAFQMWEDRLLDISPVPAPDQDGILNQYKAKSVIVPEQAVFYLAYNFESAAFSLPEVRQAFGMAINRDRLVREVHNDQGLPVRHLGPPGTVGAPPIDQVGSGYSPDRARQLMDSSPFGDCRLLPEITYLVGSSDQALQQAELLREMWVDELGCKEDQIKIEQVQFGTLLANTRPDAGSIRPDIWDLGWAAYFPDEDNWLGQVTHCEQGENRQNRPCSQVDELIAAADVTTDLDDRWELYRQAERGFFGEDGLEPLTPLYVRGEFFVKQSWLQYTPSIFGGEQFETYILDPEQKNLEQLR